MVHVGVAGWDYPDWEGVVYPAPTPRRFDRLAYLASFLDAIELNVTFYRQPDAAAARSWALRGAARAEFRFTAKLFRGLTHLEEEDRADRGSGGPGGAPSAGVDSRADVGWMSAMAERFRSGLAPIFEAGRLGAVLAQFPQRFHDRPENRQHIRLLASLLEGWPLVVEVRHRSWDHEDALRFLHGQGVGFCNVDQPAVGATLRPTGHVTSKVAYIRLHGRNAEAWFRREGPAHARYDYLYTDAELRPWAERVERLSERAEEVFVIANNHYRGKGPANALMLKARLGGARVAAPASLAAAYPELGAVAVKETGPGPAQGRLFL